MSDALKAVIAKDYIQAFILVTIGPFSITNAYIRSTTLPYDITYLGNTYFSDARIVAVDLPKLSTSVDREAYRISIGDPNFDFRGVIEAGATGVSIQAEAGFMNTEAVSVNGVLPNEPYLASDMMYMIYKGKLDTQMYTIDTEGQILLNFEGSSPMGALGLKRSLLTSRDWMHQRFPLDTSFDQVFLGSGEQILLWGKKPGGET